jgi:hypothetical protein
VSRNQHLRSRSPTRPVHPRGPDALPAEDQRHWAATTQSLIGDIYSFPFSRPMNPADDHSRDYYEVIQKPMDLKSVMKNIAAGR